MAKLILAYSGGLDTSVAVRWLTERGWEVVTLTADVGGTDLAGIEERARRAGATRVLVEDGRDDFVKNFVFPALQANALYQGQYSLATALSRPLIARYLAQAAVKEGA